MGGVFYPNLATGVFFCIKLRERKQGDKRKEKEKRPFRTKISAKLANSYLHI